MNKVILMGRFTRDPDIRYAQTQQMCVARFTLAVDRRFKKDDEQQTADFISCVAFGKTGEFIEKYGKQGMKFVIEGRIQTGSYINKDGNKVYTTDVVVEQVEFAESKSTSLNATSSRPEPSSAVDSDGFMNIPDGVEDEGLPFN